MAQAPRKSRATPARSRSKNLSCMRAAQEGRAAWPASNSKPQRATPDATRDSTNRRGIEAEGDAPVTSYYLSSSSSSAAAATAGPSSSSSGPSGTAAGALDVDQLPTYDPRSDAAKKEALDASRAGLARTLVHVVPVVVLLCGLLLWSLSATDVAEVSLLVHKGSGHKTHVKLVTDKSGSSSGSNSSSMMTATGGSDPIDKSGIKRRELRSEM